MLFEVHVIVFLESYSLGVEQDDLTTTTRCGAPGGINLAVAG